MAPRKIWRKANMWWNGDSPETTNVAQRLASHSRHLVGDVLALVSKAGRTLERRDVLLRERMRVAAEVAGQVFDNARFKAMGAAPVRAPVRVRRPQE